MTSVFKSAEFSEYRESVVAQTTELIGAPFIYRDDLGLRNTDGTNPNVGFDCSGFVVRVLADSLKLSPEDLPFRTVCELGAFALSVDRKLDKIIYGPQDARKGDIIVFHDANNPEIDPDSISHCGIVVDVVEFPKLAHVTYVHAKNNEVDDDEKRRGISGHVCQSIYSDIQHGIQPLILDTEVLTASLQL